MKLMLTQRWMTLPLLAACSLPVFADEEKLGLAILDSRPVGLQTTAAQVAPALSENLELKVNLPDVLKIPEDAIQWHIASVAGVQVQVVQGRTHALKLPAATYAVTLTIGKFRVSKLVDVREQHKITPYFRAELGRMEILANQQVDWRVRDRSGKGLSFTVQAANGLEEIVPAGAYDVNTLIREMPQSQRIQVQAGQTVNTVINIPVGQVSLIAVEENRPLFKPVEWNVFRLEKGLRHHVGSYHFHSQGITIPPGYYEVVATHEATVRSRQFWVKENTTNKVVLAMDQ